MKPLILLLAMLCSAYLTQAQSQAKSDSIDIKLPKERVTEMSPQMKAALLAAVLPGAGQVYNKKYWKLPLVYAGVAGFAYSIRWNNDRYVLFRNALAISTDNDPNTVNEGVLGSLDDSSISRLRDEYRRNRDLTIILSIAFYGLTIADAVVDAHLKDFDVSEDLSAINFSPTFIPVPGKSAHDVVLGLQLQLRL